MSTGVFWLFLSIAWMGFMAWYSRARGFNPFCWILAAGLIGIAVLECMPRPSDADTPEEAKKRTRNGNIAGLVLTGLSLALGFFIRV